jgi:hypothetical protein
MLTFKSGPAITATLQEERTIAVGESIRIFYPADDYHLRMPRTTGDPFQDDRLLGGPYLMMSDLFRRRHEWDSDECYIQLLISGYTGRYQPLQPAEEGYSAVRSLLGISVALGFFRIEQRGPTGFSDRFQDDVLVHVLRDGRADLWSSYELPADLATAMKRLVWTGRASASAWKQIISIPFSSSSKYSRVLLASEWLFYSLSGHRQVTDFLHAIVALEILLGGNMNSVSMTQMLSNRCGYLIGKSRNEIDKIVADVKRYTEQGPLSCTEARISCCWTRSVNCTRFRISAKEC